MKLIEHWKCAWRFASVQAMGLALAVQTTWLSVPDDLRGRVPWWVTAVMTAVLLVAGVIGRLVQQTKPDGTPYH